MADGIFNIAKGRGVEFYNRVKSNDPGNAAFIVVLLKAAEADGVLQGYDDLGAILGAAGNTEADFTNYARVVVTDADLDVLPAPDDANDRYDVDMPDPAWPNAGGVTNNTLVKMLVCYDPDTSAGDDSGIVPVAHYDFAYTTVGTTLIAQINAAGFFRAA